MKVWKKIFHAKESKGHCIYQKIYFKLIIVIRDKEVHYIMIKGSINE